MQFRYAGIDIEAHRAHVKEMSNRFEKIRQILDETDRINSDTNEILERMRVNMQAHEKWMAQNQGE